MAHPLLAAIFSFLIPGLGQLYNGRALRGLAFFIVAIIAVAIHPMASIPVSIVAMYDAYKLAADGRY
jgi:TM2 domain-containing membrane protein YozV